MATDPLALLPEVERATAQLLATAEGLSDRDIAGPSLLPGWTRGHVLAHVARNADGLTNLLHWARTGEVTPQYPSWERRNADIDAGAARPITTHVADLRAAVARFAEAAEAMPAPAWAVSLDLAGGPQPAARVVWRRLREVEVHHVDLDAGYTTANWPDAFSHRLLHEVCGSFRDRTDPPSLVLHATDLSHDLTIGDPATAPTITGPAHALAGWLTGRAKDDGLSSSAAGLLPTPPEWI